MLRSTCLGCPFYKEGASFVEDTRNPDAQMHIILQSPTYQAARTGTPDTTEVARGLRLSGIEDYSVGHMLRCVIPAKPKGNAAAWVAKVRRGAEHCAQYTQLPELPIVTVGKETFTFYSGDKGDIYMWRGFRTEVEI